MMKYLNFLAVLVCVGLVQSVANGQTVSCGCASLYGDGLAEIGDIVQIVEDENGVSICNFSVVSNATTTIPDGATRYCYGDDDNQWFDLYLATDENDMVITTSAPIYVWSHANGERADSPTAKNRLWKKTLKRNQIHLLSWESTIMLDEDDPEGLHQPYLDLEIIFDAIENQEIPAPVGSIGDVENIDVSSIFIGGHSRGTVASWRYAQRYGNKIKGIYFAQAFPNGSWAGTRPPDWVSSISPNLVMHYHEEIYTTDGHDPANGKVVFDAYDAAGKNARLVHSLGGALSDLYGSLKNFIQNDGQIPDLMRVIVDNELGLTTAPDGTDRTDAECPGSYPETIDEDEPDCVDQLYQDESKYASIEVFDYNPDEQQVSIDWKVRYNNGKNDITFNPAGDDYDQCAVRAFQTTVNITAMEPPIAAGESPVIPYPNLIDNDGLGLTNWPLPSKFINATETVHIAFQVKCIVSGLETSWSSASILPISPALMISTNESNVNEELKEKHLEVKPTQENAIIKSSTAGLFQIRIFNALGQLMNSEEVYLTEGSNYYELGTELGSGIYIFAVDGAGHMDSEAFIVQ